MKKPRNIKNKSVSLTANESAKGKRTIEIDVRNDAMSAREAKTLHSKLLEFIVWCDRLA